MKAELEALTGITESLSVIQQHSSSPIRIPDLANVSGSQITEWHFLAKILRGEEAIRIYPEGHCLWIELPADAVVSEGTFGVTLPLFAEIGGQRVELGTVEAWLTDPTLIERRTQDDHAFYAVSTPDRRVRFRLPDAG
jgi:hypothetical protein